MKRLILLTYLLLISFSLFGIDVRDLIDSAKKAFVKGYLQKSIYYLNEAIKQAKEDSVKAKIYDLYSEVFIKQNKINKAVRYKLQAAQLFYKAFEKTKNPQVLYQVFDLYFDIALLHEKLKEYFGAIDFYTKAEQIALKIPNYALAAKALNYRGRVYHYMGDYTKAINDYYQSLEYYTKIKDKNGQLDVLILIAQIYNEDGLAEKAIEKFFEAIKIAREINDNQRLAIIYIQLAKIFAARHLDDDALRYAKEAIVVSNQDSIMKGAALILLAKIYIQKQEFDLAEKTLYKALDILLEKNNLTLLADVYLTLGDLYLKTNQPDKAYKYIIQSFSIATKINSKPRLINAYLKLGKYNEIKGNLNRALYYYQRAFEELKDYPNVELLREAINHLVKLYEQQNNYKLALKYAQYGISLLDSIATYSQYSVLKREELKEEARRTEQKIKQELRRTKLQNALLIISLVFSIFVLIIVTLQFIYIKRKNKQLEATNKKIQQQNELIRKQFALYKRLSIIVSHTENSIFLMTPEGKIIWVNRAFLRIYAASRKFASFKNKSIFELSTHPRIREIIRSCVHEHKTVRYLNKHIIGGRTVWLQTTITPLIENGEVKELIAIESDVTAYIEAEERIKKQKKELEAKNRLLEEYNEMLKKQRDELEAKNRVLNQQREELRANAQILERSIRRLRQFSIIMDEIDNIIFFINKDGEISYANKAFTELTGKRVNDLEDYKLDDLTDLEIFSKELVDLFYKVLELKKPVSKDDIVIVDKDGNERWFKAELTPIFKSNKELDYVVVIETDVTELQKTRKKLEEQTKEIISSIEYASRIQQAILPMPIFLEALFADNYFIFNKPTNIVSGDFYWARYINEKVLFAVADATGHGIPGAFMSVLGSVAMNMVVDKIVKEGEEIKPDKFLYELKETIIHLLHQRGKPEETRDTMDVAFCVFDFKNRILEFSGAYIPLFIVRGQGDFQEPEVKFYPANNITIGYDDHKGSFTTHIINLQENDVIYITTDGYIDQFGGERNKKFKRFRFEKLIKSLYHIPIKDQKIIVEQTFEQWKGNNFQVDDVLVFGLRIDKELLGYV